MNPISIWFFVDYSLYVVDEVSPPLPDELEIIANRNFENFMWKLKVFYEQRDIMDNYHKFTNLSSIYKTLTIYYHTINYS